MKVHRFRFRASVCLSLCFSLTLSLAPLPAPQNLLAPISPFKNSSVTERPVSILHQQHQQVYVALTQTPGGFPKNQEAAEQLLNPLLQQFNAELEKEQMPLQYVTHPFWEKESDRPEITLFLASYYDDTATDLSIVFTPFDNPIDQHKLRRSPYLSVSKTVQLPSFKTESASEALNYKIKRKKDKKQKNSKKENPEEPITTPLEELKSWVLDFKNQIRTNQNALKKEAPFPPLVWEKYLPEFLDRLLETEQFLFYDAVPVEFSQELLGAFIHEKTLYLHKEFKPYWQKKNLAPFFFTIQPPLYYHHRLFAESVSLKTYTEEDIKKRKLKEKIYQLERTSIPKETHVLHQLDTIKILNPDAAADILTQAQFQYNEFDLKTEIAAFLNCYNQNKKELDGIGPVIKKLHSLLINKVIFDRPQEKKSLHTIFIDLLSRGVTHPRARAVIFLRSGISFSQQNMPQQAYPFLKAAEELFNIMDWKNRFRTLCTLNEIGAYNDAEKMLNAIIQELQEQKGLNPQEMMTLLQQPSHRALPQTIPATNQKEERAALFHEWVKTTFFQQILKQSSDNSPTALTDSLKELVSHFDKQAPLFLNPESQRPFLFFSSMFASLLSNRRSVTQTQQLLDQWKKQYGWESAENNIWALRLFLYLFQFHEMNGVADETTAAYSHFLEKAFSRVDNNDSEQFILYISFLLSQKKADDAIKSLIERNKKIAPELKQLKTQLNEMNSEIKNGEEPNFDSLLIKIEERGQKLSSLMKYLSRVRLFLSLFFYLSLFTQKVSL